MSLSAGAWGRVAERAGLRRTVADEEHAALLAYNGRPVDFAHEVLGIEVLTDEQVRFLREIDEDQFRGRWLLRGCNGGGKTGAETFGLLYAWGPMACRVVKGKPLGCLLLLSAPKVSSIEGTVYAQLFEFGQIAAERGFPLPGWEPRMADRYRGASGSSVNWRTADNHWKMDTLVASRTAARDVSHGLSGRHHKGRQIIALEEGEADFEEKLQATDGLMAAENTGQVTTLNPTSLWSPISERVNRNPEDWKQIGFAAYRHPNVIERREVIPGSVSVATVEKALRSADFEDRGPLGENAMEEKRLDFIYALPDIGLPNALGPRDDGHPGHPEADPHVWRPLTTVVAGQICDDWLREVDGEKLFHVNAIRRMMAAGTWSSPEGDAWDRVGVDCAGVRPPTATPSKGPPARAAIDAKALPGAITLGKTVEVHQGTGNSLQRGARAAAALVGLYGLGPSYVFDQAYGGDTAATLQGKGANVVTVGFQAPPSHEPLTAYGKLKNRRAEMAVHAADAMNRSMVSMLYSQRLLDAMGAVGALIDPGDARGGGKVLRPKADMERTTRMDDLDSVMLSLDSPAVVKRGKIGGRISAGF